MPDPEMRNKAKGAAKQAAGSAREKIGGLVGDEELEARGEAQRLEGKVQSKVGDAQGKMEDVKDDLKS